MPLRASSILLKAQGDSIPPISPLEEIGSLLSGHLSEGFFSFFPMWPKFGLTI